MTNFKMTNPVFCKITDRTLKMTDLLETFNLASPRTVNLALPPMTLNLSHSIQKTLTARVASGSTETGQVSHPVQAK